MSSATEFWSLVKRDAAVQAKIEEAMTRPDPAPAIRQVAAESGFDLTAADLQAGLAGELSDHDLHGISAGSWSDKEWFAEQYSTLIKGRG